MRAADGLGLMLGALGGHRSRSLMLLLAMAIGVVAVNLLTGWPRARGSSSSANSLCSGATP